MVDGDTTPAAVIASTAGKRPHDEGRFGRRGLLAGAALTGVATAGVAAGCDVRAASVATKQTPEYDVVVVGAGLAGADGGNSCR